MGEVVAGAVLKHARDFNLTRECVLGSQLAVETPATDLQQACGTGLQAAAIVADKIALRTIEAGIAGGTDTTSDAPVAISDKLRKKLMKVNAARDTRSRLTALAQIRPGDIGLSIPQNGEPRTKLSMGEHWSGGSPARTRTRSRRPHTSTSRRRTTPGSSTTRSRRSAGSSVTRTCVPTRRSSPWPG